MPSGGPRPGLRSQGSECVFPSLGQVDSPGISIWHLQPREPPLSPLQPAGWGGPSSSAFDPELCPAPQDTARSLSPLALEVSGGGQGGLPHGAAGRMGAAAPRPCPFTPTCPRRLPFPPLPAQHLPEPGPSTSRACFPRPLTPSGCETDRLAIKGNSDLRGRRERTGGRGPADFPADFTVALQPGVWD